jgi:hypothetical protein
MNLAKEDASRAYKAIGDLVGSGEKAVAFLREQIRQASNEDQEALLRFVAELDSDEFGVREQASRELARRLWEAEPLLLDALIARPSAEVRTRIDRILSSPQTSQWPSDSLRGSRAICVVERIGTPAACKVLQHLAAGAPKMRLTQEAKASLARLANRSEPTP